MIEDKKPGLTKFYRRDVSPILVREAMRDGQRSIATFLAIIDTLREAPVSDNMLWAKDSANRLKSHIKDGRISINSNQMKDIPNVTVSVVQKDDKSFVSITLNPQFYMSVDRPDPAESALGILNALKRAQSAANALDAMVTEGREFMHAYEFDILMLSSDKTGTITPIDCDEDWGIEL